VKFARSEQFKRDYKGLTEPEKKRTEVTLRLFAADARHPSLQAKKWDDQYWYYHVTPDIRLFYKLEGEWCELIAVGHHDIEKRF
jgi:mRNA-degrading endonuclease YafQ of YafQ-DinJ toxin-antitoxin module